MYYREIFKELKPKKLTLLTRCLTDISYIEELEELEEIHIGAHYSENGARISEDELKSMLTQILLLPKIRKITLGFFRKGGGSAADHRDFVQRMHLHMKEKIANVRLDDECEYFPFIFHVQKEATIVQ